MLTGVGSIGALFARASTLARAQRTVHRVLGDGAHGHVRAGGLSGDALTLLVDSPAWGSIARFKAPDVQALLRRELPRLRRIRIVVDGEEAPPSPAAPRGGEHQPLSSGAVHALRSAARSLDNPRLAETLLRLSRRGRQPPSRADPLPDAQGPPATPAASSRIRRRRRAARR